MTDIGIADFLEAESYEASHEKNCPISSVSQVEVKGEGLFVDTMHMVSLKFGNPVFSLL